MKYLNHLPVALAALALVSFAHAGEPETRTCEFKVKAGCASGSASVTLADGVVTKLEVDVFWCGLPGRPGYRCVIDSSRDDGESKWSEEGGATLIANASPFNPQAPDQVKVTVGKHVSLDFAQAQSGGRCGAGAELPRAIVIPAQGGACRVWLDAR
jgi:hypothetical protein